MVMVQLPSMRLVSSLPVRSKHWRGCFRLCSSQSDSAEANTTAAPEGGDKDCLRGRFPSDDGSGSHALWLW